MKRAVYWIGVFFSSLAVVLGVLIAWYWRPDLPLSELRTKYANAASRFVTIDGMPVHYRDEGKRVDTLPPLVLVHGTGASLHTWEGWVDALEDNYRIIRFDLPAYGLTGPNRTGDYSLEYYAGFTLELLDSLGVDTCILGGNSLGGAVAWRTALVAPGRVAGLLLVDAAGYPSAPRRRPLAFRLADWPLLRSLLRYVTPRSVIERSVRNVYADESRVSEQLIDRYYDLARRPGNRQAFLDRMEGRKRKSDAYQRIPSIEAPALILWGAQDALIPVAAAKRFQQDLPNNRLVVLDGLGHVPMEEAPERTVEVVESFLRNW